MAAILDELKEKANGAADNANNITDALKAMANGAADNANNIAEAVSALSFGSSGWTKIAETTYEFATESTSAVTVDTWVTGHPELWTSDSIVLIRIRDTAGKRVGYFYGSDNYIYNQAPVNNENLKTSCDAVRRFCFNIGNDGKYNISNSVGRQTENAGKGLFVASITKTGDVVIKALKFGTVDSVYKIEAYLLASPDGEPLMTRN